jgi:hypothetical protein
MMQFIEAMRRTAPHILLSFLACLCGATYPRAEEISVERGRYISVIGGCHDCHTEGYREGGGRIDPAKAFRGSSVGFQGPWGTSYPAKVFDDLTFGEVLPRALCGGLSAAKATGPGRYCWINSGRVPYQNARGDYPETAFCMARTGGRLIQRRRDDYSATDFTLSIDTLDCEILVKSLRGALLRFHLAV